jgi:hypothetical protein
MDEARAFMAAGRGAQCLWKACRSIGLDCIVAEELLRFLHVKRAAIVAGQDDVARRMSPSAAMDRLWHHVLLNSTLRDEVDALTGGHVPHSTSTERLSDAEKAARQLFTLGLIERHSNVRPDLTVWCTPGTVMHHVERVPIIGRHALNDLDGQPPGQPMWDPVRYLVVPEDGAPASPPSPTYEPNHYPEHDYAVYVAPAVSSPQDVESELRDRGFLDPHVTFYEARGIWSAKAVCRFDVCVRTINNKRITVTLSVFDGLDEFLSAVQRQTDAPPSAMGAMSGGVRLAYGKALSRQGVAHGSTVDIVMHLRGC